MRKKMCSWCTEGGRATKGETCANQMTDSFQAHKDSTQFLSQARAMRSAHVKRLYCAECAVYVCTVHTHRRFSGILCRKPKSPPSSEHDQVNTVGCADEGLWIFSLEDSKKRLDMSVHPGSHRNSQ